MDFLKGAGVPETVTMILKSALNGQFMFLKSTASANKDSPWIGTFTRTRPSVCVTSM